MAQDTEQRTIYVGSLWHQHCDAFVTVIGHDAVKVEAKLVELEIEEYTRCMDVPDDERTEINIMSSGVGGEKPDMLQTLLFHLGSGEYADAIGDLESDGIAII